MAIDSGRVWRHQIDVVTFFIHLSIYNTLFFVNLENETLLTFSQLAYIIDIFVVSVFWKRNDLHEQDGS